MHLPFQLYLLFSTAALTFAQTPTSAAATASVTLVDFAALPSCATKCGPLYDAQGSCTPPGSPVSNLQTYEKCFCAYSTLQSFFTESNGVCPNACVADTDGPAELVKIQSWFTSYCASATSTATAAAASASSTKASSGGADNTAKKTGQAWFHSHWKWVVMLIVLAFGIAAIWIGAFLFRRRLIRKREREIEMRPPIAWGPHQLQGSTGGIGYTDGIMDSVPTIGGPAGIKGEKVRINPVATQVYGGGGGDGLGFGAADEKKSKPKKEKKKWIVKERT